MERIYRLLRVLECSLLLHTRARIFDRTSKAWILRHPSFGYLTRHAFQVRHRIRFVYQKIITRCEQTNSGPGRCCGWVKSALWTVFVLYLGHDLQTFIAGIFLGSYFHRTPLNERFPKGKYHQPRDQCRRPRPFVNGIRYARGSQYTKLQITMDLTYSM